jgi:PPP family 3-phenylpropionic acid transporter
MKITHNNRIASLYFTIFILVSLNTVYLPVWLNEVINLNTQQIGLLIGSVGFLKVFSNFLIIKNMNTFRSKRLVASLIIFFIFCSFIFIALQENIDVASATFLSFFILLIFSPLLPIVENVNTSLNKSFFKSYGKLRISGSIAFCLGVFLVGFFLDEFGTNSFPKLYIFLSLFFLMSTFLIPNKDEIQKVRYKSNIFKLLKNKKFLLVIFGCGLVLASHAMYYSFSAIYWRNLEFSLFQIGFLWFWGVFAEIIFFLLIDKIKIRNVFFQAIIFVGIISSLRWIMTYLFINFSLLILIQSLHAFTFGLSHYLVVYYIYTNISENNKLLAISLYHALSSGTMMTILTIFAGFSFNNGTNGIGFLIMAIFCLISTFLVYFRGYILK